ncbi:DUF2252 family protein [Williamsia sp. SKLECPSW1]
MSSPDELSQSTRAELYEIAQQHDIPGRSTMTKAELIEELADSGSDGGGGDSARRSGAVDRHEQFRALAQACASGVVVMLPRALTGEDRRQYLRATLREDHHFRIAGGEIEAQRKFDKLAGSVFSFFRGTALLFYRDMAGEDATMPTVLALGDVHPENFGVMPDVDNVPVFGPNDFDEAFYAPFTWDLKRGAVGFWLAADEEGGKGAKKCRAIVTAFLEGYVAAMSRFASQGHEKDEQMRRDNAPELIVDLFDSAWESRKKWLKRKYCNESRTGFRADDEHVPVTHRVGEFQAMLDRYVADNDITIPDRAGRMRIKDVCERKGQGTASLGLDRYYMLVEGPDRTGYDDIILEAKQARRSALDGLVQEAPVVVDGRAERIAHAQHVHLVRGDRFYGYAELDGVSHMIRERAPFRDDIDLDDLSSKEWRRYARICGGSLAQAHANSDESGLVDHDIEPAILDAIGNQELFVDDIVRFAEDSARRHHADHEMFRADHALGAFRSVEVVYR